MAKKKATKKAKKAGAKNKGGAPSKFKTIYIRQGEVLCKKHGCTNAELAELMNVTERTIERWIRDKTAFGEAVKQGKDSFDSEVIEKSLRQRAIGYQFEERTYEMGDDGKEFLSKRVIKHVPADPGSGFFWLCNRDPDRWRSIQHVDFTTGGQPVGITFNVTRTVAKEKRT